MAWNLLLAPIVGLVDKVIDRVIPDPAQAAEIKLKVMQLAQNGELEAMRADVQLAMGQIDINKIEAASDSFFKSGWRPAVGWACVGGLVYQLLFRPIFTWVMDNWLGWKPMPSLELETLMTLLFGMLGLGGYRMVEKLKKVA